MEKSTGQKISDFIVCVLLIVFVVAFYVIKFLLSLIFTVIVAIITTEVPERPKMSNLEKMAMWHMIFND